MRLDHDTATGPRAGEYTQTATNGSTRIQHAGFEARHVEGKREHYTLTLRAWVRNLEAAWTDAVAEVGAGRARVWRL